MDIIITVDKGELLKKLKDNRETHELDFTNAHAQWVTKVKDRMRSNLHQFEQDPDTKLLGIHDLPRPESHLTDYDRTIRMLGVHRGTELKISEETFRMYWDDEWDWKRHFVATASNYISKSWS